jgi:DNA-binding XRE family transcriptional regulator
MLAQFGQKGDIAIKSKGCPLGFPLFRLKVFHSGPRAVSCAYYQLDDAYAIPAYSDFAGAAMVPSSTAKAIGNRLRKAREDAQLTQAHLARQLGVSFQAIQRFERGELNGLERLELIARILDVPFKWLLTGCARNN